MIRRHFFHREIQQNNENGDTASQLTAHVDVLRSEVEKLRSQLANSEKQSQQKSQQFAQEEKCIRDENMRLQRKLQMEVERREALCRHLSESESSLEMEEERLFNEGILTSSRQRTISSPVPHSPNSSRPLSPGAGKSHSNQPVMTTSYLNNFASRCCWTMLCMRSTLWSSHQ